MCDHKDEWTRVSGDFDHLRGQLFLSLHIVVFLPVSIPDCEWEGLYNDETHACQLTL